MKKFNNREYLMCRTISIYSQYSVFSKSNNPQVIEKILTDGFSSGSLHLLSPLYTKVIDNLIIDSEEIIIGVIPSSLCLLISSITVICNIFRKIIYSLVNYFISNSDKYSDSTKAYIKANLYWSNYHITEGIKTSFFQIINIGSLGIFNKYFNK